MIIKNIIYAFIKQEPIQNKRFGVTIKESDQKTTQAAQQAIPKELSPLSSRKINSKPLLPDAVRNIYIAAASIFKVPSSEKEEKFNPKILFGKNTSRSEVIHQARLYILSEIKQQNPSLSQDPAIRAFVKNYPIQDKNDIDKLRQDLIESHAQLNPHEPRLEIGNPLNIRQLPES